MRVRDFAAPVTSTPSATPISTYGEARNTWCSPPSIGRPASPPIHLALVTTNPDTTHLEAVAKHEDGRPPGLHERVLDNLAGGMVLTRAKLRDCLAVKNERLGEVLESLSAPAG